MAYTYTVKNGDTLSEIAQTYLSTIRAAAGDYSMGIYGTNGAVAKLQSWNNISDANYIVVGQVIKLGPSTSYGSSSSGVDYTRPTITIFGLVSHSNGVLNNTPSNEFYVEWTWPYSSSQTESYEVVWRERYYTNNGTETFYSTTQTVQGNALRKCDTFTPSHSGTYGLSVNVRAKSKQVTGSETTSYYFNSSGDNDGYSGWSYEKYYAYSDLPPSVPDTPTVSLNNLLLTASLEDISTTINGTHIEFQIVRDQSETVGSYLAEITITNSASIAVNVEGGHRYDVRCRAVKGKLTSAYSSYAHVTTRPGAAPEIIEWRADSITSIFLKWSSVTSSSDNNDPISYEIEHITNRSYFDITNQATSITSISTCSYIITNLNSGYEYFFRVRAVNSQGNGDWSEIKSVILGTIPNPPTTWSSQTTARPGDRVTLYWAHNSTDNSYQQYARIKIIDSTGNDVYTINTSSSLAEFSTSTLYSLNDYVKHENEIYRYISSNPSQGAWNESRWEPTRGAFTFDTSTNRLGVSSPYAAGDKITWKVQTAGVRVDSNGQPEYSQWSSERTLDIYASPTIAITLKNYQAINIVNGGSLQNLPFYISANVGPVTQKPISYNVSIASNETYQIVDNIGNPKTVMCGEEVYTKNFDGSSFSQSNGSWSNMIKFSADNLTLKNGISYTVKCTVSMNSGLTAFSTLSFTVSWSDSLHKPNAIVKINRDDNVSAIIIPYCRDTNENLVSNVLLSVYRREYDGSFTTIATDVTNTGHTNVIDPHPSLDFARYRIVAKSTVTSAVSYNDLEGYEIGEKSVIIQWSEQWNNFDKINPYDATPLEEPYWAGSVVKLPFNVDVSNSYNPDISLIEYVGRKNPVSYYGTHLGEKATWNVSIDKKDKNTLYALRRLAVWMGDVYVREPSGSGYWANIVVSFSQKHLELTIPVTLTITRVSGGK